MQSLDAEMRNMVLRFQRDEITEHRIYKGLGRLVKSEHNREVLNRIADEELRHYHIWREYSGEDVRPARLRRWFYLAISVIFGVTFGIKLMEKRENSAQVSYKKLLEAVPEAEEIGRQENEHENELIGMIDEERLKYMGSVVLGLNDALVEFMGALAGFTFALQNSRLIGMVGLIMGFSASLSMGASEYISTKTEETDRSPLKASMYTGAAYIIAVLFLVGPYLVMANHYVALGLAIVLAVFLILVFSFYFSVVRDISFTERFGEMFVISMGVAALSFVIGLFVRSFLGVDI
jgi:VIT1/CCC1 family predicted Fe2+/Mn2+ transporter